jgi:hypothetical protein
MTRKIFRKKPIDQLIKVRMGKKGLKKVLRTPALLLMGLGALSTSQMYL